MDDLTRRTLLAATAAGRRTDSAYPGFVATYGYDATVYAFVAELLCPAFDNEVRRHVASKKNLVDYEARIKEKYWKKD